MRRVLCAFLAVIMCLMIPITALAATAQSTITISVSAKRINNSHVGNSWTVYAVVNDSTIKSGKSKSFKCNEEDMLTIICTAIENDSVPDEGTGEIEINVKDLKKGKNKFTQTVIVTENRGRYSGNTAEWKFTITVKKK